MSKINKTENSACACACACACAREINKVDDNTNSEVVDHKEELMNLVEKLKTEIEDYKKVK